MILCCWKGVLILVMFVFLFVSRHMDMTAASFSLISIRPAHDEFVYSDTKDALNVDVGMVL